MHDSISYVHQMRVLLQGLACLLCLVTGSVTDIRGCTLCCTYLALLQQV
jgi:hypothetical protein